MHRQWRKGGTADENRGFRLISPLFEQQIQILFLGCGLGLGLGLGLGSGWKGHVPRFLTKHSPTKSARSAAFALGLLDCFCCAALLLCCLAALLLDFSRAETLHCLAGEGSAVDVAVWAVFLFKNDDGLSRVLVLFAKRSHLDVPQNQQRAPSPVYHIFFPHSAIELFVLCKCRLSSFECRVALSAPQMLIEN